MKRHRESQRAYWYFEELLDHLLFFFLIYERVKEEMDAVKIKMAENFKLKRTHLIAEREQPNLTTSKNTLTSLVSQPNNIRQALKIKNREKKMKARMLWLKSNTKGSDPSSPRSPQFGND